MKNIEYLRSGASEMAAEGQTVTLAGKCNPYGIGVYRYFADYRYLSYASKVFYQRCCCGAVKG